jgi:hypothetical protein
MRARNPTTGNWRLFIACFCFDFRTDRVNSDIFKIDNSFCNLDWFLWPTTRASKRTSDSCRIELCLCLCNNLRPAIPSPSITSGYRFRGHVSSSFCWDKVFSCRCNRSIPRSDSIGRCSIPISPSSLYTVFIAKVWHILPEDVVVRITMVGPTRIVTLILRALRCWAANNEL